MEVVVDIPALVRYPQVVVVVFHGVMEDHEVRQQDLVHPSPGLKQRQIVLDALALDVARFPGEVDAHGVESLAAPLQHLGDRVLGEPVNLKIGLELAQRVGDREVALHVAQADGAGDEQGTFAMARHRALPGPLRRTGWSQEVVQQEVGLHRLAGERGVP